MKLLEENVEVNFHNLEFVNIFLHVTPKTHVKRRKKIGKLILINTKTFVQQRTLPRK